ncbi:MAG: hypothetical protein K8S23_09130 [Candidatus Cloacimonetes bacterium]|nr:hypothetical protein [Candidatus Cloacimonadota bacterium]
MPDNDGGYYAIKGFEYQIDKALLEILNSQNDNEPINIEQIQDIDSNNWVIQVKYKESTKLVPSTIRMPIVQLIDEYQLNPKKMYYLYSYFGDLNGYDDYFGSMTIKQLNTILGIKKNEYSETIKTQFLSMFKMINAPKFQEQFNNVIEAILSFQFCKNYDEAIFYYSNLVDHIRKKIVLNKSNKSFLRTCTKKEIIELIREHRHLIFNSAYLEYLGVELYLKKVKRLFIKPNKRRISIVHLGNISFTPEISIEKMILDIVESYYNKAIFDIKPLTFIINDDILLNVKKYLINHNIVFNDGFEHIEFNKNIFLSEPIINKKVIGRNRATESLEKTSFKLRLLSRSNFIKLNQEEANGHMSYYFDNIDSKSIVNNSYIEIYGLNTLNIRRLFI